jgi:rubrerythrin
MGTLTSRRAGRPTAKGVVELLEVHETTDEVSVDFVRFLAAGEQAKGEFHCAECGYGVTVCRTLPRCPMCGNGSWEQSAWSPFARARSVLQ